MDRNIIGKVIRRETVLDRLNNQQMEFVDLVLYHNTCNSMGPTNVEDITELIDDKFHALTDAMRKAGLSADEITDFYICMKDLENHNRRNIFIKVENKYYGDIENFNDMK